MSNLDLKALLNFANLFLQKNYSYFIITSNHHKYKLKHTPHGAFYRYNHVFTEEQLSTIHSFYSQLQELISTTFKIHFFKNGLSIDILLSKETFNDHNTIFKTILPAINLPASSATTIEGQSPHAATTTMEHSVIFNLDTNHSFLDMPPL